MFASMRARLLTVAALIALMGSIMLPFGVSAHEHRTVATDYDFVVGFLSEPAIEGELNGVSLEVTKGDKPVTGLDATLKVEVSVGGQKKEFTLSPVWKEDGHYQAVFIPTKPGDYTFHFTGTVEGKTIDETFTSSPDGFDSVAPRSDYEFPATSATPAS
ncbi:MAG: FixH family protein [Thermomicrobiales bacterium]